MQTQFFSKGEAAALFSRTGYNDSFDRSVLAARFLARGSSTIDLPDKIELPTDRPMIIAANHSSLFDLAAALVLLGHYGIPARIGVNSRFFVNPVAGRFLRSIGCIAFSKDDKQSAEDSMVSALQNGHPAAIMPEGRLTRPDDQINGVGQGRPGISRIAVCADAAVVPIGFAFADETWAPGTPLPIPRLGRHKIVARMGTPIAFVDNDHIANANLVMQRIGELVIEGRQSRH